ncbi:conjugal transfer protein TraF [Saccharospirillum salsuginis]|uniref:Plasmid transfer operon, TraF, protein n=1 Tax=Saccharospirillum salsuginis TaxID=418750 RepID=A0A918K4C6_9GAMM|nr:conjugal transfer protein TraF [Saccharospirillum salsuginis]GGX45347.1 hypothetical protein GCM10007392_10390 [Saccharospirillum salsuginis]
MNRSLLALAILAAGTASATPFTGNDTRSNAMGNTGVASSPSYAAGQFNPALLAASPDNVNFGLTLPSAKVYIDDSLGLIEHGRDFYDSTYEDFENSADAATELNIAITGSDTELPLTDVIELITAPDPTPNDGNYDPEAGNIANIQTAIQNIQNTPNGQSPDQADIDALNNNSDELVTNSATLDSKINVVNSTSVTMNTTFGNMRTQLPGFNDKPLMAGLDLGAAFALPRTGLGLGLSINNSTVAGFSVDVVDSDLTLLGQALDDLEGVSAEATDASGELVTLSGDTQSLTTVIANQPDPNDYTGGETNPQYQSDLQDWANDLDAAAQTVDNQSTVVETELNDVTNYNGNFFTNGTFNEPDPQDLETSVEIVGANIAEVGISVAREFEYMGETFAAGVTPKLQSITVFEDTILLSNAENEFGEDVATYIESNRTDYFTGNIDVGVAKDWPDVLRGNVRAGLVIKDLIPQTFETKSGAELSIGPKMRIGGAHMTRWSTLSVDLDITENDPLKYGVPTRYLGLGGEFNAWNWLKLRAGYRNNLSVSDSHVISTGFGITPFGVGLDLSGWFKPKSFDDWDQMIQDAGVVAQFSMEF